MVEMNVIKIEGRLWDKMLSLKCLNKVEWKELEYLVNVSSEHFADKIRQDYPVLSEDDIHIILLMRIDMKNSKIAKMLHILPTSFRMRRYRLKKKMNVNCKSLSDFIRKIYVL